MILEIPPQICGGRRNHVQHDGAILAAGLGLADFDVVTELCCPPRAAYDEAIRAFTNPSSAARIASDEENLFDRNKTPLCR